MQTKYCGDKSLVILFSLFLITGKYTGWSYIKPLFHNCRARSIPDHQTKLLCWAFHESVNSLSHLFHTHVRTQQHSSIELE